jgi:hypothetical protein
MANEKISQFSPLLTLASGDYIPVVDISEPSTADQNKRVGVDILDERYYAAASGVVALTTAISAQASGNAALDLADAAGLAATAALASGNAALSDAATALASGNAALTDVSGKVSKAGDLVSGTLAVDARSFGFVSSVVSGGVVLLDFSAKNNFDLTLTSSATLAFQVAPSGGQSGAIFVRQDNTGGRTLAYSGGWSFSNGSAPSLTTTPSGTDLIAYYAASPTRVVGSLIAAVSGV